MSTEIEMISNIPITFVMVEQFAKCIGLTEQQMNKVKKHAYQTGCKFLVKAPDGHLFINIHLFNKWSLQNNFTNKDFKVLQLPFTLIKADLYASLTGYTIKAIERKREDKIWSPRVVFKDPIGLLTINITEVEKWIQEGTVNG